MAVSFWCVNPKLAEDGITCEGVWMAVSLMSLAIFSRLAHRAGETPGIWIPADICRILLLAPGKITTKSSEVQVDNYFVMTGSHFFVAVSIR